MKDCMLWVAVLVLTTSTVAAQDEFVGVWDGAIKGEGQEVRTVLHLGIDQSGALAGTVDSPEQGAYGFSLSGLVVDGRKLVFEVPSTMARWEGQLSEDGRTLSGTWEQRGARLELVLHRVEEVHPLVGSWTGTLKAPGADLRLEFHVGTLKDGTLGASMKSPDQSRQLVPVDTVEIGEEGKVTFTVLVAGARYEGDWDEAAKTIRGHLHQGGMALVLDLERKGPPPRKRRPQTPQGPFPYRAEDVEYRNAEAGIQLTGTLTMPEGEGPFAAALLITGSGAQDRDETIFEHKPFWVIADSLTRRGVAVLRVDDRGVGGSGGSLGTSTSADLATDVHAGVEYLASRPEIDKDRIGLIGHSEGGMIGPMVASERGDVAFVVMLAGPGTRGDQILYDQAALISAAAGSPQAAIDANRVLQARLFDILLGDDDLETARLQLEAVMKEAASAAGQDPDSPAVAVELAKVGSPWFRYFVRFDPAPVLREVACPVLAVNGALDLQVPAESNLSAIGAALAEAGNDDVTLRNLPGLNHLFQHTQTGSPAEYGEIEETLAPEVLQIVGDWICKRMLGEG